MLAFPFFFFISQRPRPEKFLSANDLAGDHEHAVAGVVQRLGKRRHSLGKM
jgi:hypothetical protein